MDADKPACWEVKRDHFGKKAQLAEAYFDETRTGAHCDSNWCDSPQEDPQKRIPIGRSPKDDPHRVSPRRGSPEEDP